MHFLPSLSGFYQKLGAMALSRFITVGTMLAVAMVLTRLLDEADYGGYRKVWLVYAVLGPAFLNTLASTLYYRGKTDDRDAAIQVNLLLGLLFGLVTALAGFLFADFWAAQLNAESLSSSFRAFSPYMGLAVLAGLAEPLFITLERKKWLLSYTLGYCMIEFVLIVLPFALGLPLPYILLIMAIGPGLRCVIVIYVSLRFVKAFPGRARLTEEFKKSLHYAGGIMLLSIVSVGIIQIDKWVIGVYFIGDALYATYEIGAKKLPFITAITSSVSAALVSEYTAKLRAGNYDAALREARQASSRLMVLLVPSLVILFIYAEEVLRVLFGGYEASAPVFRIYLCTLLTQLVYPQSIVLGLGRSDVTARYSIYEFIFNLCMSIILVIFIGFLGPAVATLLAHVLFTVLLLSFCRRTYGIRPSGFIPVPEKTTLYFFFVVGSAVCISVFLKHGLNWQLAGLTVSAALSGLSSLWWLRRTYQR